MISVRDIQGQWREQNAQNVWIVSGIVVERAARQKTQKKPIVLSDGPQGVEWGNGNLKGKLEDGVLVWRNRRGEATYCWKRVENTNEVLSSDSKAATRKVRRTPPLASPPPIPAGHVPAKINLQTKIEVLTQEQSPRSTGSGTSAETAALTACMGNLATSASHGPPAAAAGNVDGKPDDISVAEMRMLVEMAGNRLMAGDVYMSMRYITLAQQVQPLTGAGGAQQ
jgi:hypothetical protein